MGAEHVPARERAGRGGQARSTGPQSDAVKEEIRQRVDIVDLISEHLTLKKSGQNYKGLCPFHPEKTPSFNVRRDRGLWKCFGCDAGGDVFDFVMRRENLTFPEALERLGDRVGVRVERSPGAARRRSQREAILEANRLACEHFHRLLLEHPSGEVARRHLADRGIEREAIEQFRLGYARESWDDLLEALRRHKINAQLAAMAGLVIPRESGSGHYDRFRHRLMFPILNVSGKVIGFGGRALSPEEEAKYLNTPETPVFTKGRVLYGLNWASKAVADRGVAIVVEGYTDVVALHSHGLPNAVATLGTALTEEHVRVLGRYADEVVLAYDADSAGMRAALSNAASFEGGPAAVQLLRLPAGQDPDDFVRREGREAFERLLAQRQGLVEYQLDRIFEQHGEEDLAKAIDEAAAALARVQREDRRAIYLARVADRFFQRRSQFESVQEAVLTQARRLRQSRSARASGRRTRRGAAESEPAGSPTTTTIAHSLAGEVPGLLETETALLVAALQDAQLARRLRNVMPHSAFLLPADRELAAALFASLEGRGDTDTASLLEDLASEAARDRAIELSVAQVDVQTVRENLEGDVGRLKAYRRARGKRRRYASGSDERFAEAEVPDDGGESFEELTARVMSALAQRDITPSDPMYADLVRWRELSSELHGSGDLDYWEDR
ncbi:MAG: DNA primase [Armatimonadota bacterium]